MSPTTMNTIMAIDSPIAVCTLFVLTKPTKGTVSIGIQSKSAEHIIYAYHQLSRVNNSWTHRCATS